MKVLRIIFLALFVLFSIVEIYLAFVNQQQFRIVSTAALMPLLALYYIVSAKKWNWLVVAALVLSCLGDLLNLWQSSEDVFMMEIGAFLLALICYIIIFQLPFSHYKRVPHGIYFLSIPYMVFGVIIYLLLRPSLGEMEIPAAIYLVIVLLMSFSAMARYGESNGIPFWLPLIGSLFFIASDVFLAFNAFTYEGGMAYGDFLTTVTYIPAQFLIVFGLALPPGEKAVRLNRTSWGRGAYHLERQSSRSRGA